MILPTSYTCLHICILAQAAIRSEERAATIRKTQELQAVRTFIRENELCIAQKRELAIKAKEEAARAALAAEAELERRERDRAAEVEVGAGVCRIVCMIDRICDYVRYRIRICVHMYVQHM